MRHRNAWAGFAVATGLFLVTGCGDQGAAPVALSASTAGTQGNTAPTATTQEANRTVAGDLQGWLAHDSGKNPVAIPNTDEVDADRGLVGREDQLIIRGADGTVVWDMSAYDFEQGDAPDSVNPSLWRQARLNNRHGLYRVAEGIHQVRGYDLSNLSIIQGDSGWIVVDPLTTEETAAAAMALARKHLGDAPIVAVILTHSHLDHFGGIGALVSPQQVASGKVRIIAPKGFLEEATSENVLAGIAMGRRAGFMYGFELERSPRGHVGTGLGKTPARGTLGILPPTDLVDRTPQEMEIDGVRFIFQYAPESEAPAELTFYLPDHKAFCAAELVSHTLHNLYTLRGTKVRDALKWSGYIDEALHLFGESEVLFGVHNWPTWGNARILDYLEKQRDTYKYIHDQTLRMANAGLTSREIAEELSLPDVLQSSMAGRGYYGTVRHNAKAVYQSYFGWYDGNPANLNPLPPTEEGQRYVEFMGGADAVLKKAQSSFDVGDYRWTATVLNHLVFAEPDNGQARELLASTYDQLGYQAESAPWRDVYLTAALELRGSSGVTGIDLKAAVGLLRHTPIPRFLDSMATRLKGPEAEGVDLTLNFIFPDLDESYVVRLNNSVLNYRLAEPDPQADVTLKVKPEFWLGLVTGQAGLRAMIFSDDLDVDGSRMALLRFFSLLDKPTGDFAIVTP